MYDDSGKRMDWEEVRDLSKEQPGLAREMKDELLEFLKDLDAGMTYYNPTCTRVKMPGAGKVISVIDQQLINRRVRLRYQNNGAELVRARIIYSMNGTEKDSEWFPLDAKIVPAQGDKPARVEAKLPPRPLITYTT